jgi:Protein of unknown function (DUF2829)
MDFNDILIELKNRKKIRRSCWQLGNYIFLELGLTHRLEDKGDKEMYYELKDNTQIPREPSLRIHNHTFRSVRGYQVTIEDLIASDWEIKYEDIKEKIS